jgi:hypothetical protein
VEGGGVTKYYPSYKDIKNASDEEIKEFLRWDFRGNTCQSQIEEAVVFKRQLKKEALKRELLEEKTK